MKIDKYPLKMVGGTQFGRYGKISQESLFNMLISDGFIVPYAGYKQIGNISISGEGRGIYASNKFQHIIFVSNNTIYIANKYADISQIGTISTFSGDVSMAENNANQIAICDKKNIYIFDYNANTFQKATTSFTPSYVSYHNGYFIAPDANVSEWQLSAPNQGLSWPSDQFSVGGFSTKGGDIPVACLPAPSDANLLYVFGSQGAEYWYDVGNAPFPYIKNEYRNIDFGAANSATIATMDKITAWVAINEKAGPSIMFTDGDDAQQLSNDGINYLLSHLNHPEISYGFFYRQDGHLIYQCTFADPSDNITFGYDFTSKNFISLTDQNMNIHIAKRLVAFNNRYYFVSFIDGNLYELNSEYYTYSHLDTFGRSLEFEIPRVRTTNPMRESEQTYKYYNSAYFTMEAGEYPFEMRIDMSLSKNGGASFSNYVSKDLNLLPNRPNRCKFWQLGQGNDLTMQFRFNGKGRFVVTDGNVEVY